MSRSVPMIMRANCDITLNINVWLYQQISGARREVVKPQSTILGYVTGGLPAPAVARHMSLSISFSKIKVEAAVLCIAPPFPSGRKEPGMGVCKRGDLLHD